MQAIQRDHGRFSLTGIILAVLALLVWIAWFFLSPIPVYEYGAIVKSTRDGSIIAQVAPSVGKQIVLGQVAYLHFQAPQAGSHERIRAFVTEINQPSPTNQLFITLYPEVAVDIAKRRADGESGEVEIEVEQISPAVLVLRSSGQFLESTLVSPMPNGK